MGPRKTVVLFLCSWLVGRDYHLPNPSTLHLHTDGPESGPLGDPWKREEEK